MWLASDCGVCATYGLVGNLAVRLEEARHARHRWNIVASNWNSVFLLHVTVVISDLFKQSY